MTVGPALAIMPLTSPDAEAFQELQKMDHAA
jgi:hypothetical protein